MKNSIRRIKPNSEKAISKKKKKKIICKTITLTETINDETKLAFLNLKRSTKIIFMVEQTYSLHLLRF